MKKINGIKRVTKKNIIILNSFTILLLSFCFILLFIYNLLPLIYDVLFGKTIIQNLLINVVGNETDINITAQRIMNWEEDYFYTPYFASDQPLKKFGIYFFNHSPHLFIRDAPVSWIIFSRLANCEEYAKVFVYLMNKTGVYAKIVHAPGEDHAWAEYYVDRFKVIVDPSQNRVISNPRKFAKGKNWSYVESYDLFNPKDRKDVSLEYIQGYNYTLCFEKDEQPLINHKVEIMSSTLMKKDPKRYKHPLVIKEVVTNDKECVTITLAPKTYIFRVKGSFIDMLKFKLYCEIPLKLSNSTNVSINLRNFCS